ncbi:DUF2949 domain-containing protein [Prochlorococcus sp. MIT 1307]|uniref:DUF2949 domain-containing protein n=1 Tax=Prochlorococcus sp. MIT 1307 TaxID=3096219 RepID=UPI002A753BB8|nr:DUF2949 domain-containing protein [Prochlorococcus sp. MIT 1307]
MVITTHKQQPFSDKLINHLLQKVGLSQKAIDLGLRQAEIEQAPLPIMLWSFGLLSILQYQEVIDWQREND